MILYRGISIPNFIIITIQKITSFWNTDMYLILHTLLHHKIILTFHIPGFIETL